MAHKHWETWVKIACLPVILLTTIIADFTTECQRPCDCRWQSGNKAAICSNSSLKSIPSNLSSDIQILDLSNNNLQQLHQEAFKKVGLSNLKKLFLRDCNIDTVHKAAFTTLAIMIELDLSKNRIRYLHQETFKGTEKLRLINLSNNFIDKLEDGLFRNLMYLQKVEVSNNRISRIGTKTFVNLPQLKILRIDGNNLSYMKPETFLALHNLSGLDLHNNPWRCDCNLQTFRDWVISHNLYTPPTSCAEPIVVQGKLWNELDSSNFACRPTILEPQAESIIKSHDVNVTLVCKVVGNPAPEVFWRFNGKLIEVRAFGEIRYVVNENTLDLIKYVNLTILHARYTDRGNYSCVAENPGGKDEKSLTLILSKYDLTTIAGMDAYTFVILIGCLISMILITGAVLSVCYFTAQNNESKRLIKADTRSSNGEALIESSIGSDLEKGCKTEVNLVTKPPRKYEAPPSLTSEATEMSEINRTLLDSDSILASADNSSRRQDMGFSKVSQELLLEQMSQDNKYPPDLLTFPLRGPHISPANTTVKDKGIISQEQQGSPVKPPAYGVNTIDPEIYRRFYTNTSQVSMSHKNPKAGYMTLPRRPRTNWFPETNLQPHVYSTMNGVIPYHENFNMRLFGNGGNYYSLNKSELDLGPVSKFGFQDGSEDEPAPSPAPGTPHANIPRNSLSSPNIHNQLMMLQAMSMTGKSRIFNPDQKVILSRNFDLRPVQVTMTDNNSVLKNSLKDLRIGYSVNVGSASKARTMKPAAKPKKRGSCELKEPFLLNTSETATEV